MAPTLLPGDYLLAYKLPFGLKIPGLEVKLGKGQPKRGDLVLFPCPGKKSSKCVRRVIGLPGDRVEVIGERLVLNNQEAEYQPVTAREWGLVFVENLLGHEHQVALSGEESRVSFGPVIVAPGQVFVLSDHRDLSEDSRNWGGVPIADLEARVPLVWLSQAWPTESKPNPSPGLRWERVFHSPD